MTEYAPTWEGALAALKRKSSAANFLSRGREKPPSRCLRDCDIDSSESEEALEANSDYVRKTSWAMMLPGHTQRASQEHKYYKYRHYYITSQVVLTL